MLKILMINLIIAFSVIFVAGCRLLDPPLKVEWLEPDKPSKEKVFSIVVKVGEPFIPPKDGVYLDEESARKLLNNINELDAYIEKQDALIKKMKRYYRTK